MTHDLSRTIFYQALALLEGDEASPSERFAAEETVSVFVRALRDDERCVTDLLAYVRRALRSPQPRGRHFYVGAAALRAVRDPERAMKTASRVMEWAADAGDDGSIAYLLEFYCCSHLRRCDVGPALIERGYESAVRHHTPIRYVASLVRCAIKEEEWLRRFVEREMDTLARFEQAGYDSDMRSIRDFLQASSQGEGQ